MYTEPGKHGFNDFKEYHLWKSILRFIHPKGRCADVGCKNPKMEYIKKRLGLKVIQIDDKDFNFSDFGERHHRQFDTVFCFEVIEHVQNALSFMQQVQYLIKPYGVIYLSTPGRLKILWTKHHFHEMPPARIDKWIFKPLGLKIIRKKRIWVEHSPFFYFKGFRPLLRLFLNYTWIYELRNDS